MTENCHNAKLFLTIFVVKITPKKVCYICAFQFNSTLSMLHTVPVFM